MLYDNNIFIGRMIKEIRSKLHITQKEMAQQLSVTPQTISAWELGKRTINQGDARLIFEKFNISVEDYYRFLPPMEYKTIVRYCTSCGTIHICPHSNPHTCCGTPTKPVDKCRSVYKDCIVCIRDNTINVSVFKRDLSVKYIAYVSQNSINMVLCDNQLIPHAEFKLHPGSNLYMFVNKKGLFKIHTSIK